MNAEARRVKREIKKLMSGETRHFVNAGYGVVAQDHLVYKHGRFTSYKRDPTGLKYDVLTFAAHDIYDVMTSGKYVVIVLNTL